jgi:hypothetical protein
MHDDEVNSIRKPFSLPVPAATVGFRNGEGEVVLFIGFARDGHKLA